MKKNFLLILLIFCFAIIPLNVNAEECTAEEIERLEKIAGNIKYKYEEIENNKYKINFLNLNEIVYVNDVSGYNYYSVDDSNSIFEGGINYSFFVMGNQTSNCPYKNISKINISFPKYNVYSENDICKNDEYYEFKLCAKYYSEIINDEIWNRELNKYEEKMKNKDNVITTKKDNVNLLDLIKEYKYYLCGGILLILIIIIVISNKKRSKLK